MLIVAKDLEQTYQSGGRPLTVLSAVNLEIARNEFDAIVGPSGSGKTTLLGLLAGLDRPSAGSVAIDGRDLNGMSEDERASFRAHNVGSVFQTFQLIDQAASRWWCVDVASRRSLHPPPGSVFGKECTSCRRVPTRRLP
jgi:putative ABC transport system ATP-binding protein